MSSINKPYIINLYEDQLEDQLDGSKKFKEYFILTIGSDTMESQNRAMSPKFVKNINGTNTLTFTMYYKYIDTMTGYEVENPFIPYITNERKVKLNLNNDENEWYDLIIKDIKQNTEKKTFEVTCTDQYVNELSKNGFNIELNTELMNNQGSAQELATDVMEGTDWSILPAATTEPDIGTSEFIPAFSEENLVRLKILKEINAYQIIDPIDGAKPTVIPIKIEKDESTDEFIYAFYSSCTSKPYRFQFFYFGTKTEISKSDDRIVTELNCQYYIDYPVFPYNKNADTYNFYVPKDDFEVAPNQVQSKKNNWDYTSAIGVCVNIRGRKYNYVNDGEYNSLFEEYLTPYLFTNDLIQDFKYGRFRFYPNAFFSLEDDKGRKPNKEKPVEIKFSSAFYATNMISVTFSYYIGEEKGPSITVHGSGLKGSIVSLYKDTKLIIRVNILEDFPEEVETELFEYSATKYLCRNQTKYITPNLVQDLVTNPDTFKSTSGWKICKFGAASDKRLQVESYNGQNKLTDKLIEGSLDGTTEWTPNLTVKQKSGSGYYDSDAALGEGDRLVNTGWYDNRKLLEEEIIKDKQFIVEFKGYKLNGDEISFSSIEIANHHYNAAGGYYVEKDVISTYNNGILTLTKSLSKEEFLKDKYAIFITCIGLQRIEKLNIYPLYRDKNGALIKPGSEENLDENSIIDQRYRLYNAAQVQHEIEINGSLDNLIPDYEFYTGMEEDSHPEPEYNGFLPILSCEKVRNIDIKESNYFNILQEISEKFEAWAEFKFSRASDGSIQNKYILFHNYIGQENYVGIKYGINLKSIQRTDDSKQIVTKLIVKQNSNEFGKNGFSTIVRASSNETGDNSIYNMDYYIQQGLLSAEDWQESIYDTNGAKGKDQDQDQDSPTDEWNSNGYYVRLHNLNFKLDAIGTKLEQFYLPYTQTKANLEKYQTAYDAAVQTLEEESDKFYNALGFDWRNTRALDLKLNPQTEDVYITKVQLVEGKSWINFLEKLNELSNENFSLPGLHFTITIAALSTIGSLMVQQNNKSYNWPDDPEQAPLWDEYFNVWFNQQIEDESGYFYFSNDSNINSYFKDYSACVSPKIEQKWEISSVNWEYFNSYNPQTFRLTWHSDESYTLTYYNIDNIQTTENVTNNIDQIITNAEEGDPVLEGETYLLIYNGGSDDYESRQARINSPQFRPYLVNVATAYQQVQQFESKLATAKTEEEKYKGLYDQLLADQKEIIDQKVELNKAFYRKYNRFIQEGTWISEDYYDDEKYYQDALSTLYNSCYPKVSYTINVLELSQLEGYEDFTFKIGDRTYIEDPEFFGYIYDEDLNIDTPYRELVTLTEITYNLDEPDKNTIKVQNYKNAFQDLFHRISATIQSVQYTTGAYERAAELAEADTAHKVQYLTDALNSAAMILQNMGDQTVTWDNTGITVQDSQEQNNLLRIVSRGILLSEDGGENWRVGITAKGISADVITTGVLNTETINIMNGSEPTFVWNSYGLTAYDFIGSPEVGTYFKVDTSKGVRFDKFGIYGFNGIDGANFKPTDVGIGESSGATLIYPNADFGLTKEGFWLRGSKNSGDNQVTTLIDGSGILIKKGDTELFSVDSNGNLNIAQRLSFGGTYYIDPINFNTENNYIYLPGLTMSYEDGVSTANFNGTITAKGGTIGGWTIKDSYLTAGSGNNYVAINASSSGAAKYAFWAGHNWASEAPFAIFKNGQIRASAGYIGGFTISSNGISYTNPDTEELIQLSTSGLKLQSPGSGGSFTYTNGELIVEGRIIANAGNIGGCQIDSGELKIPGGQIIAGSITVDKLAAGSLVANTLEVRDNNSKLLIKAYNNEVKLTQHFKVTNASIESNNYNSANSGVKILDGEIKIKGSFASAADETIFGPGGFKGAVYKLEQNPTTSGLIASYENIGCLYLYNGFTLDGKQFYYLIGGPKIQS